MTSVFELTQVTSSCTPSVKQYSRPGTLHTTEYCISMAYQVRSYSNGTSLAEEGDELPYKLTEESRECLEDFRRKWIPGFDSVFKSAADVAADWYYLYTVYWGYTGGELVVPSENLNLLIPLVAVTIISTIMFVLVTITYFVKAGDKNKNVCCVDSFKRAMLKCCCRKEMDTDNFLSLMEYILEDFPSIVLTFMIESSREGISPAGVLNVTTSAFSLVFNMLRLLLPKDKVS